METFGNILYSLLTPVQLLGAGGFVCSLCGTLQTDDEKVKGWMAMSGAFFTLHYWLLGAITGAIVCGFAATRSLISMYSGALWIGYAFMVIHTIIALITAHTLPDFFAFIGGIVTTLGLYFYKGVAMRLCFMVVFAAWLAHNVAYGSVFGSVMSLVFLATTGYTLLRLRYKGNPHAAG
ncbi:MAG: YgjV family protein [Alphaproteobacteria bacterium]